MERYDKVGYNIDVQLQALAFDDEYMVQMYTNLINNYTVFKILTDDERNLQELESVHPELVAPKFIKEIKEEQVDSPDLPDVEVRRVFVEEVMQAQLDAEQAAAAQVAQVKSDATAALAAKTAADTAELQATKEAAAAELVADVVGRVVFVSAGLGVVVSLLTNPPLFFPLIVMPLIVLLVLEIRHMVKTTQDVARAEDEAALRAAVEQIREKRRREQEEQGDAGDEDDADEGDAGDKGDVKDRVEPDAGATPSAPDDSDPSA